MSPTSTTTTGPPIPTTVPRASISMNTTRTGLNAPPNDGPGSFRSAWRSRRPPPLGRTGLEADYEGAVRFRPDTVARVNRTTDERHPVKKGVRPDLLVRTAMSMPERERFMPKGVLCLDRGALVPRLVLEVLSKGSANRDLNYKKSLYEAAGIAEYLIYDLGGKHRTGSPRELLMYRLEGGAYRRVAPESAMSVGGVDAYWSEVFDTPIRMRPHVQEEAEAMQDLPEEFRPPPHFQWYDPNTDHWRDRETDREREWTELEGERAKWEREQAKSARERAKLERERTQLAIGLLRAYLGTELEPVELDQIEAAWHRDGPPPDVMDRIRKVQQAPNEWRSLLGDPEHHHGSDHVPPSRDTDSR